MMEANKELEEKVSSDSTLDILPLEDNDSGDLSEEQQFLCGMCKEKYKQPKVLHCLHSFCTECLEKSLHESGPTQITCQICKQVTRLTSAGGVNELPIDAVICNLMEMEAICSMQVICTSCKTQENAVARCSDCSNFLCPNCVTAHNYMRCFEKHKVDTFETLKNGKGIHKPMFCQVHPSEPFQFYCKTCQVLTCTECMVYLHKRPDHQCERVVDLEAKQRSDFREAIEDTKDKVSSFDTLSTKLENLLSELQSQRDNACDLIKETFQSFKAVLEKRRDEIITELESVHSEKELAIMDMFNSLDKTGAKMTDTCKFVQRTIKHADAVELLSVSKLIKARMQSMKEEMPHSDMAVKIELQCDVERFSEATKECFCSFRKHYKSPGPMSSSSSQSLVLTSSACAPSSSSLSLPLPSQMNGSATMQSNNNNLMQQLHNNKQHYNNNNSNQQNFDASTTLDRFKLLDNPSAVAAAAALNMPPELLSSLTANLPTGPLLNEMASSIATTLSSNASLQGLTHPLNFAERSLSRNSYSPTISDSGVDVSATATQQTLIQQLLKSGQIGISPQGHFTLNGQPIQGFQGLNWNLAGALTGHTSPPNNQPPVCVPSLSSENALAGLLTTNPNLGGGGGGSMSQASTPSIGEISALLNTLNNHSLASASGTDLPMNGVFPAPGQQGNSTRTRSSGKTNAMEIRTKFGQLGPGKGQFNAPHGFCLGMDEDIVVADTNNHRIQVFEKNGDFKYQFGIPGREEGQLWYPRKVAVIRMSGRYVVCDRGNERSRMQLFTRNGQFIKKIAIRYIDIVAGLAITSQGHIVAVDSVSPTVFCISEMGELIKWFDCSDYMREPSDIAVSGKDYYVCDFKGHCVVVFNEEGHFLHRIGCESITNYPNGIDISDAGDVLIGDSHGNRFHVAVFQRDGSLIGEFECPYVKVSRCCGLKITSEGYIVTLAKNNQHVLVLNTLYIA